MDNDTKEFYKAFLKASEAAAPTFDAVAFAALMEQERAANPENFTPSDDICGAEWRSSSGYGHQHKVCILTPGHREVWHLTKNNVFFIQPAAPGRFTCEEIAMTEARYSALFAYVTHNKALLSASLDPQLLLLAEMRLAAKGRGY